MNIEESHAVDLSLHPKKAPCSTSEVEELTLKESSACPDKSHKEEKLLEILRLASRPTGDQGMLCHLCDLEVSFYLLQLDNYFMSNPIIQKLP